MSLADAKKAEYVYLEAANAYTQGRADDYIMLLRHAAALNPYDPFIAGALGEVTIQLSRDSAVIEKTLPRPCPEIRGRALRTSLLHTVCSGRRISWPKRRPDTHMGNSRPTPARPY